MTGTTFVVSVSTSKKPACHAPTLSLQARPAVTAVRVSLAFDGFSYQRWGHTQRAQAGDCLVDNDGNLYTVAADSFARTYRQISRGRWVKFAPVWAEQAAQAGSVATREGPTHYEAGDRLVSNAADGSDAYAVSAAKFEQLYKPGLDAGLAGTSLSNGS